MKRCFPKINIVGSINTIHLVLDDEAIIFPTIPSVVSRRFWSAYKSVSMILWCIFDYTEDSMKVRRRRNVF